MLEDDPAAIATLNPGVPAPVAWIVERCLAKDATDRYAATRDLARDLEIAAARFSELSPAVAAARRGPRRRLLACTAAMMRRHVEALLAP